MCSALKQLFTRKPVALKKQAPDETWVQVIRRTDDITDDQLRAACAAVELQVRDQLSPAWFGYYGGAVVEPILGDQQPSDGAWWVSVTSEPDDASSLGYHDLTATGKPQSKVFTKPTLQGGEEVSGVISHEVCEMIVDPLINQWAFDLQRYCFAMEASDAVQGYDYDINGVKVANFVTSRFFDPLATDRFRRGAFDHLGVVDYPFQTMPTGYQLRLGNNGTIDSIYGNRVPDKPSVRALSGSRRERRRRGHRNWQYSTW